MGAVGWTVEDRGTNFGRRVRGVGDGWGEAGRLGRSRAGLNVPALAGRGARGTVGTGARMRKYDLFMRKCDLFMRKCDLFMRKCDLFIVCSEKAFSHQGPIYAGSHQGPVPWPSTVQPPALRSASRRCGGTRRVQLASHTLASPSSAPVTTRAPLVDIFKADVRVATTLVVHPFLQWM